MVRPEEDAPYSRIMFTFCTHRVQQQKVLAGKQLKKLLLLHTHSRNDGG